MNITEYRALQEALDNKGAQWAEGNPYVKTIADAARLTYGRYQECDNPSCDGGFVTDRWAESEREWLEGTHERPCPSCGGGGLLPNQAGVERVRDAIQSHGGYVSRQQVRAAVRAFDKENNDV